jgi:hypothetical protein
MTDLKTGDLILFCGKDTGWLKYFSEMIKYTSHSNYSHVGMILKDPTFIHPTLKGTYVWESGWEGEPDPQDGKIKLGVQITPLDEILKSYQGSMAITRTVHCHPNLFNEKILKEIHQTVYDKPYDILPVDWVKALFRKEIKPTTERFWCSALIGYIYTKCGILQSDTDWSILRPSDFSLDGESKYLKLSEGCSLSKTETRIA